MEYSHEYIGEFVKLAQDGDSDAFAQLYSLTFNKIYNYSRHYLKDEYLAQDAVQEIFIVALRKLSSLNEPTLFIAWLNQIAFHVCYDMQKSLKADYGEIDSDILEAISDTKVSSNPEASTCKLDESLRLKKAIDSLSATKKELITLRYFNNMKIDEIVNVTEMSKSTVKRQLQAAIDELNVMMKG